MHQFVINNLKGMLKKVAFYDSAETENQTEFFYFFWKNVCENLISPKSCYGYYEWHFP